MAKKDTVHFTALKEILYGAGISFSLGMIGYVLMFFFKLIVARYLGPSDFGLYELVVTILGIGVVLGDFGLSAGIQRYIPYYLEKKRLNYLKGYINFVIFIPAIFSVIIGAVLFFYSNLISSFFSLDSNFSLLLKIISVGIPLRILNAVFVNILLAKKKIVEGMLGYHIVEKIVLFIGAVFIIFMKLPLIYLVLVLILSFVLSSILSLIFFLRTDLLFKTVPKYAVKEWIFFSLPLIFTGILVYLINWTDNVIIGKFLDAPSLGIYGVSYSVAGYINFIPAAFASLFMPVMTSLFVKNKKIFRDIFSHATKWIFISVIFVGAILIYFSKEVILIVFGPEYVSGHLGLVFLSSFFIISSLFSLNYAILMITKKTSFLFYNYLFFSIFNIFLSVFLIKIFGISGVAFASGLSFFLVKLSEYFKSKNQTTLNKSSILKIILVGSLCVLFIQGIFQFILNQTHIGEFIKISIALIIYTVTFIFLLFFFKILNNLDFKLILLIEKKLGLNLKTIKLILKRFIKD